MSTAPFTDVDTRNRLSLEEQQDAIRSIRYYPECFHDTSLNNFSVECINKRYDANALSSKRTKGLQKLNIAAYNLLVFADMCLSTMKTMREFENKNELLDKLSTVLGEWYRVSKAGNSFLTYPMAAEVITGIRNAGFPIDQFLNNPKYRVILNAFTSLNYQDKAFVRISVHIRYSELYSILSDLVAALHGNPLILYYIERIELAKERFSMGRVNYLAEEAYPSLSILFDSRIVSTHRHPVLTETMNLLLPIIGGVSALGIDTEYGFLMEKNTTLSQGFRSYKKYLRLLNIIDNVYDQGSNYAFIANN